jgi:hypothetical protein
MVIDFAQGSQAVQALRVLSEAGVAAVYTPDKLTGRSANPLDTHLITHRIEVPDADRLQALVILRDCGLHPPRGTAPAG